eukprot:TRINITY_DN2368_c0_g1_i2.p1 TRINITY_DN2368_c0_g1~~TRINITY_DN2368_c0_g1_i2.p1  ORF type:complete len:272 (-),score=36.23 TRINITY_DN2368_c0_g1_i2:60-875(-)
MAGCKSGRQIAAVLLCVTAAQEAPACAWTIDGNCPSFDFGGEFTASRLGEKTCPEGSETIIDELTCRQAQRATGLSFFPPAEPGENCHFCGGCQPHMIRQNGVQGMLAKTICRRSTALPWPACQEQNSVIRNAGHALFANLLGYGAMIGCYSDDCSNTDKFFALQVESCTKVCKSLPECKFWVWGMEGDETKCWLRTGDAGRQKAEGWVSGARDCHPPGVRALVKGNPACWRQGFSYDICCDTSAGRRTGNVDCWDLTHHFDECCFPKDEL